MMHQYRLPFALCLALAPAVASAQDARAVLQTHCAGCHGGGKAAKGGFGFVLDRDQLVSRLLVTPGQAAQSDLFQRVQNGEMPPKSAKTRLTAAEIKILKQWIDSGAAAFEAPLKVTKILTPPEVTDAILTDLQALDPRRLRFTRYLTLAHFAQAGRSAKDLATVREAAGKLVNSLSWHPRIALPEAVDADGTILRLDLRAYKWSAAQWERLVSAYPYRLQTAAESKAFAALAGSEFPAVRADWFVANASRPPLYHDFLQLPVGDRALERQVQVDVVADINDDNIQRAGFNDSGVSKNNRLLERHDSAYGAFWRSYDFSNNNNRQNLFDHPLGPNAGATSFQPAGGEMIFHLPNGLQAYMLVDGKGKRIDKGPIEIVADPRRPDQKVETGISCMSCHARGLLFKADQLREHVEKNAALFGKQVVATVHATHPRKAKFQAQIEEDNVRYLKALEKFGVRDPDQEPVNLVTQRFEGTIDGVTAASEFGLKIDEFAAFLKQNPEHARLFGALIVKGGTAQRTVFQDNFPELARRLLTMQAAIAAKSRPKIDPAFEGHTNTVNAVAFSSDGKRAVSGSDDRTIRIWDIPSGRLLATLESNSEVYAVAFSPDGKQVLSAGRDRALRLWDVQTKNLLSVFKGHTDAVRCVAFSSDGKRAASGGDDRSVRVWDIAAIEEKWTLTGHTGPISGIAWSRDRQRILTSSRDGTARWWDVANQKELKRLEGHAGAILSVALSSDGKSALTGGNDQTVRLWNLAKGTEVHCFKGHATAVVQVQFATNGRDFLSSGSQHRTHDFFARRWDLINHDQVGALKAGEADNFGCAAFSPDGKHVLVGGPAGFLKLLSW
jgi:mono/diheme cytochrome c family protein